MEPSPPSASLYTRDGQRKYLTPAERQRLIARAAAQPRADLETLVLMLAFTGCRISEALALTVQSIDTAQGIVAIRSLKKRGRLVVREIPLPPALLARLADVHDLAGRPCAGHLWSLSRGRAWTLVKTLMLDCGIADGPHSTCRGLRHGFAIHALRRGVPLTLVSRWLGHASIATTSIYTQVLGVEEREFACRMWAPEESPTPGDPAGT